MPGKASPGRRPVTERIGAARLTDARVWRDAIVGLLRPGPSDALAPLAAGARPGVPASPMLARQYHRDTPRARAQMQTQAALFGSKRPYQAEDARNALALRSAVAGQGREPLSYTYRFSSPFAATALPTPAVVPGAAVKKLPDPCDGGDCG